MSDPHSILLKAKTWKPSEQHSIGHLVIHVTFLGHDSCSKVVLSVDNLHLNQSCIQGRLSFGSLEIAHVHGKCLHTSTTCMVNQDHQVSFTALVSQHHLMSDGDALGIALVLS